MNETQYKMVENSDFDAETHGIEKYAADTIIMLALAEPPERRRSFIGHLLILYDCGYEEGTGQNMFDGVHNETRRKLAVDAILEYIYG